MKRFWSGFVLGLAFVGRQLPLIAATAVVAIFATASWSVAAAFVSLFFLVHQHGRWTGTENALSYLPDPLFILVSHPELFAPTQIRGLDDPLVDETLRRTSAPQGSLAFIVVRRPLTQAVTVRFVAVILQCYTDGWFVVWPDVGGGGGGKRRRNDVPDAALQEAPA